MTKALTKRQAALLNSFASANPDQTTFTREEMFKFAQEQGLTDTTAYTLMKQLPRAGRAVYQMSLSAVAPAPAKTPIVKKARMTKQKPEMVASAACCASRKSPIDIFG
jgi:hypothetical protein